MELSATNLSSMRHFYTGFFRHLMLSVNVTGQWAKEVARLIMLAFNNTVGKDFSSSSLYSIFSKLENHIGAIWSFIHHYNACLQT